MIEKIHWLGHASFRIDGSGATIYIDPWKLRSPVKGDLVLVTHEHFDHLSVPDIAAVSKKGTVVVCAAACRGSIEKAAAPGSVRLVAPGDELTEKGVTIRAVPAYNTEPERKGFHPRDAHRARVGFLVTVDGATVYHTGDTDAVPEMAGLAPDVLLIPVGGTYTMDAAQAAQAAAAIGARVAVPMHWGDIVGGWNDAREFEKRCACNVKILEKE